MSESIPRMFTDHHWKIVRSLLFRVAGLTAVLASLLLSRAEAVQAAKANRPNIILIMADDLGVEGLGCYGGTSYRTPSLDRLARQGLRFTHAYAQPLCTNTRVQLMTGLYNNRNWLYFGILDPKAKTIGHYFQEAGYQTCMVGKWQLQSYDPPDFPGSARRRGTGMRVQDTGFDEYSLWHTAHTEDKGSRYADPVIFENGKFRSDLKGRYGPDVWGDYIQDYLKRKRDDKRPFFLYYPMALPHWPMVPTPDSPVWSDTTRRLEESTSYFKDMVEYTDKCVGRIVDSVDTLGLKEQTLIVFYSDNGTHLKIRSETRQGSVAGGKGRTTDAGTHVPLIVRWPGTVRPGVNDDLVDSTDFLPTLREAAEMPVDRTVGLDGVSFFPRLRGEPGQPRSWVFCHFDPRPGWDKDKFRKLRFARDKTHKLYQDGRLFHIPGDRLEQKPILSSNDTPATRQIRRRLSEVLDRMPNPDTASRE